MTVQTKDCGRSPGNPSIVAISGKVAVYEAPCPAFASYGFCVFFLSAVPVIRVKKLGEWSGCEFIGRESQRSGEGIWLGLGFIVSV